MLRHEQCSVGSLFAAPDKRPKRKFLLAQAGHRDRVGIRERSRAEAADNPRLQYRYVFPKRRSTPDSKPFTACTAVPIPHRELERSQFARLSGWSSLRVSRPVAGGI